MSDSSYTNTIALVAGSFSFFGALFGAWLLAVLTESQRVKQAKIELTLRLHAEFQTYIQQRIDVWKAYEKFDVIEDPASPTYAAFWVITGFYQRLGLLLKMNQLHGTLTAKLHGNQALDWHKHFFVNKRTHKLGEQAEIKLAAEAWPELLKHADPGELGTWEILTREYNSKAVGTES